MESLPGSGGASGNPENQCYALDDNGKKTQVSCAAMTDMGRCSCVATGCGANYGWGGSSFDITFDANTALGSATVYSATALMFTKSGS